MSVSPDCIHKLSPPSDLLSTRTLNGAHVDSLSADAKLSPRLRCNLNLHQSPNESVQRFFNAVEPGSYVAPHRHCDPNKVETLVLVRGAFGLVLFDDSGGISGCRRLAAHDSTDGHADFCAQIDASVWHTVVSLASGSVFFEVKAGPYHADTAQQIAPWAPPAGSEEAQIYVRFLERLFL